MSWSAARRRRSARFPVAVAVAAVAVVLPACIGEAEPDGSADDAAQVQDLAAKPNVSELLPADRGDPPGSLVVDDVVVGDGAEAVSGSVVDVHYVGVSWSDGSEFDASWDRGQPFRFELGAGDVIAGWDQGVTGMRVGGRRMLTIPPDLAYEDRAAGDSIRPNETLVFVVDLLEVDPVGGGS